MNESVKLTKDMLIVLAVSSVPSLRLATKSLLHVSPSLCQLCQEILTSSHTPCHRERISSHVVCCTGITAAVDVLLSPFWVPNDSFCPEAKSEMIGDDRRWRDFWEPLQSLLEVPVTSYCADLCSTEPQTVRSLKRWNLTMQGMSDLGKPPASLGSVSLDSQGQKSWSHDGGIPTLNKQTRTSQRRQILPSPPHCCQTGKSGTPRARRHCAHCDGQWNVIFCWPSCLRHWRVLQILSSAY